MVSSKKSNKEKKPPKSDDVDKAGGRNTTSSRSETKKKTTPPSNKVNSVNNAKMEPEFYEISESSSSGSMEGARRDELKKSNGAASKGRDEKSGKVSMKRKKNGEEDDCNDVGGGVEEDAKAFKFPMNRIRRIMRSDDIAPQIMQDSVFLVNKATEMFIERFSEEAYESSVEDKKKFIHYKHLSSVVSSEERYNFLTDCVPEKLKAETALEEWERNMTGAS